MDIDASLIDQQLTGIIQKHSNLLPATRDDIKQRSLAFVLLCIKNYLDITLEEASELLTDGSNDGGVDGINISEIEDDEFLITIFQCKYKINNFESNFNFPENAVKSSVALAEVLLDPYKPITTNDRLTPKVEEIRSLIKDGYIPNIKFVFCNNGLKWNSIAQQWINDFRNKYGDSVSFDHFNHNSIINILRSVKKIDTKLLLSGKVAVEDLNFIRVLTGRISVQEIYDLFKTHGDRLLQRNIRRYLGLHNNRVNQEMHQTLLSDKSENFYFYNNGIAVICEKFEYNAFQNSDYIVRIKNMQIINGAQTCKTIYETLNNYPPNTVGINSYVMIRLYELSDNNPEFIRALTYATNNQNPVELRDLHSNDDLQIQLEIGIKDLGYIYKRQREESIYGENVITSPFAAEAILSIWKEKPHQAKFKRKELFGKLYNNIFREINAAQTIIATVILREVGNQLKIFRLNTDVQFIPYATHYIAMVCGRMLLKENSLSYKAITHQNFTALLSCYERSKERYLTTAIQQIRQALVRCYGERTVSLQQLAATFRRGDLLEMLP